MIALLIGFIIAGVLLIAEYMICTKLSNPLWGGIIPLLILIFTIYTFASGRVPFENPHIFPFVVVNTLYFGQWGTGRDKYKKLKLAELEKMKAKDM
ncbi:MAG: hypothetical protein RR558_07905 [Coprobacillus sp.]